MEGGITNTPLLSKEVVAVSGEDTAEQNGGLVLADNGVTMVLALATLAAVSGFYAFGNIIGYSSPAEDGILSELGISSTAYSVFGSMMNAGGLLGALCSGKLADLIGRKGAMWVTDITCILGWLGIAFAENAWMLDTGRLFVGFGVGIVSYAAPVYIAEVTPTKLRGTLAALNVLMSGLGISMFSIIGVLVN